ncbi:MAG: FHA domain-containing protein [Proteobacteria bacterium]|nr:FHA domain-containing protein [Pseudomonadota bacterium]
MSAPEATTPEAALEARVVQLKGRRRVASAAVRGAEFRIGRDPTSDLILGLARVSRRHAVIRLAGDHHTLCDDGSVNGTRLNGSPVQTEPVPLASGDLIQLADEVALLYETGPERPQHAWIPLAVIMLTLCIAAAGVLWWLGSATGETP